mmetsp:Transcript_5068/g.14565  ORF Transcript_5068/g.14565 Transcript_5068/m.14565 type:complete len:105 (-) Transcript_5068:558-872(-)|eukprot:CAMPEP_0113557034 /NCGR_PEP_ID=MMETSP0015_2-20120614/17573_1 /TAXON_ID=2838 /ORGANISM="Odontella" /LENGTH=104 /DNA_ID=CAMNT_0000458427 /DNA_START=527 /DNA_END=841 /DNA_ORIENTATION=- /assembly_acc=CAM_ASM_000160
MTGAETLLFVAMSACDYAVPVAGGACCMWYALSDGEGAEGDTAECGGRAGDSACPPRFRQDYWRCDRQQLPQTAAEASSSPARMRIVSVGSLTDISHADSSIAG